jgi:hypothetical protein
MLYESQFVNIPRSFERWHRVELQAGGLPEISRWLTERGSAEMASPQAMARRAGHDRAPALAGGHGYNEAWRATPPEKRKKAQHPGEMPEIIIQSLWHPSGMRFCLRLYPVVSLAKPRSTTGLFLPQKMTKLDLTSFCLQVYSMNE